MENHKELSLGEVRKMIIRYGAKYMENFEVDLYYDCNIVGSMSPGESVFWMVSATHTYTYTARRMHELGVNLVCGNRFNYRIDCVEDKCGDVRFDMTQVNEKDIQRAADEYKDN